MTETHIFSKGDQSVEFECILQTVIFSAIVNAVKISMKFEDDDLTHGILYSDFLASKNYGDEVCKL